MPSSLSTIVEPIIARNAKLFIDTWAAHDRFLRVIWVFISNGSHQILNICFLIRDFIRTIRLLRLIVCNETAFGLRHKILADAHIMLLHVLLELIYLLFLSSLEIQRVFVLFVPWGQVLRLDCWVFEPFKLLLLERPLLLNTCKVCIRVDFEVPWFDLEFLDC